MIPTVKTAETRLVADEVNQAISNPTEHQVEEEGQEEDDLCHLAWMGWMGSDQWEFQDPKMEVR